MNIKLVIIGFISVFIFFLNSCVSIPKTNGYELILEGEKEYYVEIESVNVIIDRIRENDISTQFEQITETILHNKKTDIGELLSLDICINQRGFYKGLDKYNSIYLLYSLTDETGNVVFKQGYFVNSLKSLEQSVFQCELSEILVKKVNDFLKRRGN